MRHGTDGLVTLYIPRLFVEGVAARIFPLSYDQLSSTQAVQRHNKPYNTCKTTV